MHRGLFHLLPWSLWFITGCITGCKGCNDGAEGSIPPVNAGLGADVAPAPDLAASQAPVPPEIRQDALWARAINTSDDIDLASLADREGASGLLDAFEHGGRVGATALAAMPFAPDAPVAYRRLAEVMLMTTGNPQYDVIRAVHDIALRPATRGEPMDEGGREACATALSRVARNSNAPKHHRALALSTLRLPAFSTFSRAAPASSPSR